MENYYKKYGFRNYLLFLVEGGAFIGAVGFINPQTLLPSLILDQGGPEWLAALAPSLMVIGMFSLPILTYNLVDGVSSYKKFVSGFAFVQRFIYLIAGLLLLYVTQNPLLTVLIISLTPLLSGAIGGVCLTGWQQLYMGSFPPQRRASNLAIRFLIGGLTGVVAGKAIELTLRNHPGSIGYGHLHLYASAFFLISFIALLLTKENPHYKTANIEEKKPEALKLSKKEHLKELFGNRQLRPLWPILFLMHCMFLITPFYAVSIRMRFDQDSSFLGVLAFWQMLGSSMGNLTAGLIGDRMGGKVTFMIGSLMFALCLIPGALTTDIDQAKLLYMLYGFFMMVTIIGKDTVLMESSPVNGRSFYLSIAALVSMFGMLASSMVSYVIWKNFHSIRLLAYPTALIYLITFILLFGLASSTTGKKSPFKVIQRGILRYFR